MLKTNLSPVRKSIFEQEKNSPFSTNRFLNPDTVFGGFTFTELCEAFTLVQNLGNWKDPIKDAEIHVDDIPVVEAAITFFTCSASTFTPLPDKNFVLVSALGYYICVGA